MSTSARKSQALIAIATQQRSGSKWVGSLVRERYGTISLGEIFNPDDRSILSFRSYISNKSVDDLIGCNIHHLFDRYFDDLRTYLGLFYSFDVMFNQIDWINFGWRSQQSILYSYLMSRGDIIISLIRDIKDIYISMKALDLTKRAHYTEMDAGHVNRHISSEKCYLDYKDYSHFRDQILRDRLYIKEICGNYSNYIELHYEDIVQGPEIALKPLDYALRRFGESIGYPFPSDISPFPSLVKSPHNYSELIGNFDEVSSWPS